MTMSKKGMGKLLVGGMVGAAPLRNGWTFQKKVVVECTKLCRLLGLILSVHVHVAANPEVFILDGHKGFLQVRPLQVVDTLDVTQINTRPGDVADIRQIELAVNQINQLRKAASAKE